MTHSKYLKVVGAREHNLKDITVNIPRDQFIVITGLSGSGKSSLAFDTIYAEGQRRYVESLSTYARQFIGVMEKPDVDVIEGLSPAISIEQKTTSRNPRSTVGTITEIYDYLRLLFARVGTPHCPSCGKQIQRQTASQIVDRILEYPETTVLEILAPRVRGKKGQHRKIIEDIIKSGYVRARIDGEVVRLDEGEVNLEKNRKHSIEILVDRLKVKTSDTFRRRLSDSVETALCAGEGLCVISVNGEDTLYSEKFSCVDCGISIEEVSPRMFSFNSPYGACPDCSGLGSRLEVDIHKLVRDPRRTIANGAFTEALGIGAYVRYNIIPLSRDLGFDANIPFNSLPQEIRNILLYGISAGPVRINWGDEVKEHYCSESYEGLIRYVERRYRYTDSEQAQEKIRDTFMKVTDCQSCGGARLKPASLAVKIRDKSIMELSGLTTIEADEFFKSLEFGDSRDQIASPILKEIRERLLFLRNVGLDYLTLSRTASTLSGGEAQRIRLATQIGSALVGVLYVLDEPTIGLHPRDTDRLLKTLFRLRDIGNTLIVIEHDRETIEAADYVIDLGPGAGREGGEVVFAGPIANIYKSTDSLTGQYLAGKRKIERPLNRRKADGRYLVLKNVTTNNLKNIDVSFPIGLFICVTGVSGSGKSSLVNDSLYPALKTALRSGKPEVASVGSIHGTELVDKIINIDQSPIGRTPRSNPSTYTKVFDHIRELFSKLPDSRARGYKPGRFSFNVKGGRCEACAGDGVIKVEMHFLPDIYIPCEVCEGMRYNKDTLDIRYRGKNIFEVLEMTVSEALEFFKNIPQVKRKLKTLQEVGLGYVRLGHPAPHLSGGEAQRVKLASELAKQSTGRTVYLLDEPTTGLHFEDVRHLLRVLQKLVDAGNTVIVIEHNVDVMTAADWLIDLGPGGGIHGGEVVAEGSPEKVATIERSITGKYLFANNSSGRIAS